MSACEENEEFFVRDQRYHSHRAHHTGLMEQINENAAVVNQLNSALECLNCFMNADFFFVRCCWRLVSLEIHTILSHYITVCRSASWYLTTAVGAHSHTEPAYGK